MLQHTTPGTCFPQGLLPGSLTQQPLLPSMSWIRAVIWVPDSLCSLLLLTRRGRQCVLKVSGQHLHCSTAEGVSQGSETHFYTQISELATEEHTCLHTEHTCLHLNPASNVLLGTLLKQSWAALAWLHVNIVTAAQGQTPPWQPQALLLSLHGSCAPPLNWALLG